MKKQNILSMALCALMATATLTSCEGALDDIFGEWDKPAPSESPSGSVPSSVVEEAKALGATREDGALISVNYTVNGTSYTAVFKKEGDNYVLQSNTAAAGARALTRSTHTYTPSMTYDAAKDMLILKVQDVTDNKPVLESHFDVKTGQTEIVHAADGASVEGMKVGEEVMEITNPYDKSVKVKLDADNVLSIYYKADETWEQVIERYKGYGEDNPEKLSVLEIENDKFVKLAYNDFSVALTYDASNYVNPTDAVGKNDITDYSNRPILSYLSYSWENGTLIPTTIEILEYTEVTEPTGNYTVEWTAGTYVVKNDVVINNAVWLKGNVKLILCDGKKLTINKDFSGIPGNSIYQYGISIYGQSKDIATCGSLEVTHTSLIAMVSFKALDIHGGNITAKGGKGGINSSKINVYGGKLVAERTGTESGHGINSSGLPMNIYGGEVEATCNANDSYGIYLQSETLTVYGGKLQANNVSNGGKAIGGYIKSGSSSIKFYGTDDTSNWGEGYSYVDAKYVNGTDNLPLDDMQYVKAE